MLVDETSTAADRPARRAAVLGSPIRHSLSPVLHGAAYQALGLHGWRYDMIECDEPGLAPLLDGMGPEWAGLSLTMPLKRVALAVADEVSPLARAVGAANTLVFPPGGPAAGRRADNTDVAGLVAALLAPDPATVRAVKQLLAGAPGRTLGEQAAAERTAQAALQRERRPGGST